jgi:hypothetical protein
MEGVGEAIGRSVRRSQPFRRRGGPIHEIHGLSQPTAMVDVNMRIVPRLLMSLFCLFFTVGGIAAMWNAGPKLLLWNEARTWPMTDGKVTQAELREVDVGPATPGSKRWFAVDVRYSYSVAGKSYEGTRVGIREVRQQLLDARARAESFRTEATVKVFFDPLDPTNALIDRDAGGWTWVLAVVGPLLFAYSIFLWKGFAHAVRAPDEPPRSA